ncbi:hypothetical protein RFI_37042 [Reticulomyxa filosa]|uniref:Uncharacterized protein n=1 Tax=Reticulomyxa filosa TaxID=46433 RepID=X6LGE4_RETFI|nr:hypothetical protein RFI_37042 [Reticulomyxa filosa]|eukprot:ETO00406.1 hypothetical protein RFI_37042 [Reticulomyxa filosa]
MEQFQDIFSTIEKQIISRTWNLCKGNSDDVIMILSFIIENKLKLTTQHTFGNKFHYSPTTAELVKLLEENKHDKETILRTWKQSNQIYLDTSLKLMEISSTYDINKLKIAQKIMKESNELKIMREMCLYILWNILYYPKIMKYRQININSFYKILTQKCYQFNVNIDTLFANMQYLLIEYGFQKGNDGNLYYYDTQFLLWKYYIKWIGQQPMCYLFIYN